MSRTWWAIVFLLVIFVFYVALVFVLHDPMVIFLLSVLFVAGLVAIDTGLRRNRR